MVGLISGLAISPASAALTLLVNPETRALVLNGSDLGFSRQVTSSSPGGIVDLDVGLVQWQANGLGTPERGSGTVLSEGQLFTVAGAVLRDASVIKRADPEETGTATIRMFLEDSGALTVTGTGEPLIFGSFTEETFAAFVLADGQELPLLHGSGFSPISVTVVPEPSTAVGVAFGSLTLFRRRRRDPVWIRLA